MNSCCPGKPCKWHRPNPLNQCGRHRAKRSAPTRKECKDCYTTWKNRDRGPRTGTSRTYYARKTYGPAYLAHIELMNLVHSLSKNQKQTRKV